MKEIHQWERWDGRMQDSECGERKKNWVKNLKERIRIGCNNVCCILEGDVPKILGTDRTWANLRYGTCRYPRGKLVKALIISEWSVLWLLIDSFLFNISIEIETIEKQTKVPRGGESSGDLSLHLWWNSVAFHANLQVCHNYTFCTCNMSKCSAFCKCSMGMQRSLCSCRCLGA